MGESMETKHENGWRQSLIAAALSASFAGPAWSIDLPSLGDDNSP